LVGLCKLGSSGGSDATWRPFSDGSVMKLAEACRRYLSKRKNLVLVDLQIHVVFMFCRFLINPAKDKDMRKWAVEGLSYLTLDAEIKEKLIEDRVALQALIDVAKVINDIILRILKSRIYFKFFSY